MPGQIPLNDDLNELIGLLKSHDVEFIIVGAHVLAFYARPRFTEDLDIFVRRSRSNANRIRSALTDFGLDLSHEAELQLAEEPRGILILGNKPHQVDLLNFLDGVAFDEAWNRRVPAVLGSHEVGFLSLEDYVATKRATGRAKDLDDLSRLREALREKLPGD